LRIDLNRFKSRVTETENACAFQSSAYESAKEDIKNSCNEIKNLLDSSAQKLKGEREKLKCRFDDMDARSMKVNLLYYGLAENEHEDCGAIIKTVCTDILDMPDANTHLFENVRRVGPKRGSKPRPILVTYRYFSEREAVRLRSYDKSGELKAK
jgi:hypothetical protein